MALARTWVGGLANQLRCFSAAAAQADVVSEMIGFARGSFKVRL